jgi:para-aminobenzoate synthetase/4-amino-4-deoxychorismate lyase
MSSFALLDDCDASDATPTSRLYEDFLHEHRCVDPRDLDRVWAAAQADLATGRHLVVLADYEWGAQLLEIGAAVPGASAADAPAALRLLVFARLRRLGREAVDAWLAALDGQAEPGPAGALVGAFPERAEFDAAIERIHRAIRAGETYQVNYTYRVGFSAYGSPVAFYRRLRARQPVPYGAFIRLPPGGSLRHVLSCSPELFLRKQGGRLTARPMKGTLPRCGDAAADAAGAAFLAGDAKNRAENLMIVDLLRNDLGRIAETGSVEVPALFSVEPWGNVLQMTSTVTARLAPGRDLPDVLRALFPCGSITGAPKHQTMRLIAGLESTPRGLYTGAIGWVDAAGADGPCGDFCLSVAIRTALFGEPVDGLAPGVLGLGAGITIDSSAADEYAECVLKGRFLTGLDPGFELFETMRARRTGIAQLQRHLDRMAGSAARLGFAFDRQAALDALDATLAQLPPDADSRLRLALAHGGGLRVGWAPLAPLPPGPVGLRLAPESLRGDFPLAGHKTTLRRHYDLGVTSAEAIGAFDTLFHRDGVLTEGGRSSVFLQLDGRWCTPPLACGVLPGVMRGLVLEDPAWNAVERVLTVDDLARAEAIMVCNALRGTLPARLLGVPTLRHGAAGAGAGALADSHACESHACIGLGSNLEDPAQQILAACDEIATTPGVRLLARSSLYRSAPIGYAEQPDFLNAVVTVATRLSPRELLAALFAIEQGHRRVRRERNGPRTLDLDILIYGDLQSADATLVLPHPRMHERAFVLRPLLEIAPDCVIPGRGPAAEWLRRCADQPIERLAAAES